MRDDGCSGDVHRLKQYTHGFNTGVIKTVIAVAGVKDLFSSTQEVLRTKGDRVGVAINRQVRSKCERFILEQLIRAGLG